MNILKGLLLFIAYYLIFTLSGLTPNLFAGLVIFGIGSESYKLIGRLIDREVDKQ